MVDELGHQVVKFNANGDVLMKLGKTGVAGKEPGMFDQPNAVIVAPNGDIFVSEGHNIGTGNARIQKFSKDGTFIKQWGSHGAAPGQFEMPHTLAFDSKGRLFVGDRGNDRIQVFDQGMGITSSSLRSSAARAAFGSTRTIPSMSAIRNPARKKAMGIILDGSAASGSAV